MKDLKAEELLEKYLNGLCTPEEKALVESVFLHILNNSKEEISANEVESASANMRSVIE